MTPRKHIHTPKYKGKICIPIEMECDPAQEAKGVVVPRLLV
jgi:hypothetical protein